MKAVIMAGGEGARLRPLTLERPKPLAPLCGKPVISYILDLLMEHGVHECAVTTGYLHTHLERYFIDHPLDGMQLHLVHEDHPLGTAGGVRHAAEQLGPGGLDEDFLVISGDALCAIDLSAAMARHRERGAAVTLVVKRVEDPSEYGLTVCDEQGDVTGFVEKPALTQATTNLANTGIYVLSARAAAQIPPEGKCDFASDLFPRLLQNGDRITSYVTDGYWCDIGDLQSYLRCQYEMLTGAARIARLPRSDTPMCGHIVEPVHIGRGVSIGEGAQITGPCVIGDGVTIGERSVIEGGVLLNGCHVGAEALLRGALLCPGSAVKAGAVLEEGCVLGDKAVVGGGARLEQGVRVWPNRHVHDGARVTENLIAQDMRTGLFDDEGIAGEVGVELTPELFVRLGCAIGSYNPRLNIAVACCDDKSARALKAALIAGIQSSGAQAMDFGAIYRSLFNFSVCYTASSLGVYISCGRLQNAVQLVGPTALGVERETERAIEALFSRGEFTRADAMHYGERIGMEGMQVLYASELLRHAPFGLYGMHAQVKCSNRVLEKLLIDTLQGLGCETADGPLLQLDGGGCECTVVDDEAGKIEHHRLICLAAFIEMSAGNDVSVPYSAPRVIEQIANELGRTVYRYYDCPTGGVDRRARELASTQCFLRDGAMLALRILAHLKLAKLSLAELNGLLPVYSLARQEIGEVTAPAALMGDLSRQMEGVHGEGLLFTHRLGLALIRPSKRGDRIRIFAESRNVETAEELCAQVLDQIKKLRKGNA